MTFLQELCIVVENFFIMIKGNYILVYPIVRLYQSVSTHPYKPTHSTAHPVRQLLFIPTIHSKKKNKCINRLKLKIYTIM